MKKLVIIVAIFIINGLSFMNAVYATSIDTVNLYAVGECGKLLKYKGVVVLTNYIQYSKNGVEYPAYCMDKTKQRSRNTKLFSIYKRGNKRCRTMEKDY